MSFVRFFCARAVGFARFSAFAGSSVVAAVGCSAGSATGGADGGASSLQADGTTLDGGARGDGNAGGGPDSGDFPLEAAPPDAACASAGPLTTYDALGSGTTAAPYLLCNAAQLISLSATPAAWSRSYRLGADVDLGGNGPASTSPFSRIGTTKKPFNGTFDGADHEISNVTISAASTTDVGFFGVLMGGATVVKRTHIRGASVTGYANVGVLAGRCDRGARILGSSSEGAVTGVQKVGGLVGSGTYGPVVSSSWSSTSVLATGSTGWAGGLAGILSQGAFVINSFATGNVSGNSSTGGFVGSIDSGGVFNSYATGNVTSTGTSADGVGGFVGSVHGTIYQGCISTGNVTANTSSTVGRFAGDAPYGTFTNNRDLSTSSCQVNPTTPCPTDKLGGSLADLENPTGSPLSTWDLARTWVATGGTLPTLRSALFDVATWDGCAAHMADTPFAGGDGTPDRPYLVCSASQFAALGARPTAWNGVYVEQMAAIDFSKAGVTLVPIGAGSTRFVGVYNGNGMMLSNFTVTADSGAVGLFGTMTGTILRVGAVNGTVNGGSQATNTGMIVGNLYGTLADSFATGAVTGQTNVGAIGDAHTMVGCYASVSVTATHGPAGGLNATGGSDGLAYDVFASSSVTAPTSYYITPTVNSSAQVSDAYYDNTKACAGCQAVYATGEATSYFYSPSNPPLANWDFETLWMARAGDFPVLR